MQYLQLCYINSEAYISINIVHIVANGLHTVNYRYSYSLTLSMHNIVTNTTGLLNNLYAIKSNVNKVIDRITNTQQRRRPIDNSLNYKPEKRINRKLAYIRDTISLYRIQNTTCFFYPL